MKLGIKLDVWHKMRGYAVAACPNEVSGFGTICRVDDGFVVNQVFIPEQKISPICCESEEGAINGLILDLVEKNPSAAESLRFRWHSHAESKVFWSSTDEKDIRSWEGPWVINLVMNINGDYLARLDLFHGVRMFNIPLEVVILSSIPNDVLDECRLEVKRKTRVALVSQPKATKGIQTFTGATAEPDVAFSNGASTSLIAKGGEKIEFNR